MSSPTGNSTQRILGQLLLAATLMVGASPAVAALVYTCESSRLNVYPSGDALNAARVAALKREEKRDPAQRGRQQGVGPAASAGPEQAQYLTRPTDRAVLQQRIAPGGSKAQLIVMKSLTADIEAGRLSGVAIPQHFRTGEFQPGATKAFSVLSAEPVKDEEQTLVTLDVPMFGSGLWTEARFALAVCPEAASGPPLMLAIDDARISSWWGAGLGMVIFVLGLYWVVVRFHDDQHRRWNPIRLTAGEAGRGSLSKLQIYFFTLVVAALLTFILLRTGVLSDLSEDVLWLLGIGGAGTAGAKLTAINRQRLAFENWSWLRNKGWLADPPSQREPRLRDLLTSDGQFDVFKFQMLAFSLIVATALLTSGFTGLEHFQIPDGLLGLLGLSQVLYVGGKAVGSPTIAELDQKVTDLRKLELAFMNKLVADGAWQALPDQDRTLARAAGLAATDYAKYSAAAEEAATMVEASLGEGRRPPEIEPALPRKGQLPIAIPAEQGAGSVAVAGAGSAQAGVTVATPPEAATPPAEPEPPEG
jgi:hypothetical protein